MERFDPSSQEESISRWVQGVNGEGFEALSWRASVLVTRFMISDQGEKGRRLAQIFVLIKITMKKRLDVARMRLLDTDSDCGMPQHRPAVQRPLAAQSTTLMAPIPGGFPGNMAGNAGAMPVPMLGGFPGTIPGLPMGWTVIGIGVCVAPQVQQPVYPPVVYREALALRRRTEASQRHYGRRKGKGKLLSTLRTDLGAGGEHLGHFFAALNWVEKNPDVVHELGSLLGSRKERPDNYNVQCIGWLQKLSTDEFEDTLRTITSNLQLVGELAFTPSGCLVDQVAYELAHQNGDYRAKANIRSAMSGQFARAAKHMDANYLIQKIIVSSSEDEVQALVVTELGPEAKNLVRHEFGNRVFSRLLESVLAQARPTVTLLWYVMSSPREIAELCEHPHGHHVFKLVLEKGAEEQKKAIASVLKEDFMRYANHENASSVVERALANWLPQDQASQSMIDQVMRGFEELSQGEIVARKPPEAWFVLKAALNGPLNAIEKEPGQENVVRNLVARSAPNFKSWYEMQPKA